MLRKMKRVYADLSQEDETDKPTPEEIENQRRRVSLSAISDRHDIMLAFAANAGRLRGLLRHSMQLHLAAVDC